MFSINFSKRKEKKKKIEHIVWRETFTFFYTCLHILLEFQRHVFIVNQTLLRHSTLYRTPHPISSVLLWPNATLERWNMGVWSRNKGSKDLDPFSVYRGQGTPRGDALFNHSRLTVVGTRLSSSPSSSPPLTPSLNKSIWRARIIQSVESRAGWYGLPRNRSKRPIINAKRGEGRGEGPSSRHLLCTSKHRAELAGQLWCTSHLHRRDIGIDALVHAGCGCTFRSGMGAQAIRGCRCFPRDNEFS